MPVLETKGALSAQGYGLTASRPQPAYIEDVFSTWLYTGNGSTQTINNGIDLAGKGGLVWIKNRNIDLSHFLFDTNRGATQRLITNGISAQLSELSSLTAFNNNGFSLGNDANVNTNPAVFGTNSVNMVSWTFREQPRFFDVVTFTAPNSNLVTFSHNLQSVPGCVIIKSSQITSGSPDPNSDAWYVWHRSLSPNFANLYLNTTAGQDNSGFFNSVTSTQVEFYPNLASGNSRTYVAYLFAHNAGGFGATGADNVISCGSYTGNGSTTGPVVALGYEPQWVIVKATSRAENWFVFDAMRGLTAGTAADALLQLNNASAELQTNRIEPTATGFSITSSNPDVNGSGDNYIYIAIRRGPMRTPTSGTSVFAPVLWTTPSSPSPVNLGFPADASLRLRRGSFNDPWFISRLTGGGVLITSNADAEATNRVYQNWDNQQGYWDNAQVTGGQPQVIEGFRRAPGFFDVVCYTGDGTGDQIVNHNLGVMPDLTIVKARSNSSNWWVASKLNETRYYVGGNTQPLYLNSTASDSLDDYSVSSYFNSSTFRTSAFWTPDPSASGHTYVAYLFASCPGVSKVGSYTGTGATQIINCGFSSGARFILIRRIGATGDWYVWDSARGIVAGNDPYLRLNSTAAEVTTTDWVDTAASGFELSNAAGNLVNTNGGSYIFLAIA